METPEDERTVTDLMIDQIEFADVIIVNKVGLPVSPWDNITTANLHVD